MTQPPSRVRIAVAVPARDEAQRISTCLASVRRSLAMAVACGQIDDYAIAVVAHRCTDATAALAERSLVGTPHRVLRDERSDTVGAVRSLGVRLSTEVLGQAGQPVDPRRTWVMSTDADSVVPLSWVGDVLGHARSGVGAVAVVGMTSLSSDRPLSSAARAAYRAIIDAGRHGDSHDHVYGANLAVRLDAYLAVGGFPRVAVGEDQALVDALAAGGLPIARPVDVVVRTSGRRHGRAAGGLADLLARLEPLDRVEPLGRLDLVDRHGDQSSAVETLRLTRRKGPPAPAPATS